MARRSQEGQRVSRTNSKAPAPEGFLRGNVTKLKMLLPIGKPRAWAMIATADGLSSWFPAACDGTVAVGEVLAFQWADGSVERFRVRRLGNRRSSIVMEWRHGAEWRIYLHGRRTTLTLEVEYGPGIEARGQQLHDLPLWAFRLANLKSVALTGQDLRQTDAGRNASSPEGFIDSPLGATNSKAKGMPVH